MDDLDTLMDIARHIEGHTICPFGEAGSWPVQGFVRKFRKEFEEHILRGKAAAAAS
jgi:NADH-quinone oxidoreductase subunit F